jgi:hypothetical protein
MVGIFYMLTFRIWKAEIAERWSGKGCWYDDILKGVAVGKEHIEILVQMLTLE